MWKRRSVLATGAALSIGTGLASVGAGAAEADVDELPDPDRDPGPNEDWPSHRGDPGHARYVADGHEFDGGALEAAWSVDSAGADSVAVADETVYASTDGGVVALDAADGTVVWENADVDASDPSVAGETVFFTGNEIVALDRSDGSVRWESEFDPEAEIVWQTVAYGGVYVVVGGTLYALEADDGSVRWKKESITAAPYGNEEDEYEFVAATAAANGVIYSVTGAGPIALEPETGTEVWQEGTYISSSDYTNAIYATSAAVGYDISGSPEVALHDPQTGESVAMGYGQIAFGEEIHVGDSDQGYGGNSIYGDEYSWSLDVMYTYGQAVISGETVFVYFTRDGGPPDPEWRDYDEELVALNKYDGSEKWVLSRDEAPVGRIRAISGETIYVDRDGVLVALRDETDEGNSDQSDETNDDRSDEGDENDDTDGGDDERDGSDEENEQQSGGDTGEDDSDDDPADDEGESSGDGSSSGGETGEDDSDDDSADGEDGSSSDGSGSSGDDRGPVDDGADDGGNETVGNGDAGNETAAENDTDADNVPGFTTGGGLLGGALGLEWLRRKAGVDESTDVNEPAE